jgi:hypothetical protein
MKRRRRRRWILALVLLIGAAAAAVPYLGAQGFAASIQRELERVLGRKVELHGEAHFQLLPWPGFSVADVVIHEDPSFGVEQFAYVPSLEVGVGLDSLWRRRMEFASLRLVAPSINLMKAGDGRWNVQSLVERARGSDALRGLPVIEVSEGRLNFKSGDLKSAYHLAEADVVLEAVETERISLRFAGIPARTDRGTHGFGRVSGRGSVRLADASGPGRLDLSVALERTAAAEILTLLQGRGIGLGGFVRSQARLSGPLTKIEISGRLELDDFERWSWLLPGDAGWGLDYRGAFEPEHQTLEIETRAPEKTAAPLPLSVRLRATRLLTDTRWAALVTARAVPLSSLRSLAEETGSDLPVGLPLEGVLTGALSYSPADGFRGQVAVADAAMNLPDLPPLRFEGLSIVADGSSVSLGPAILRVGERQTARLEAHFMGAAPVLDVKLSSNAIALSHLQGGWRQLTGEALPPMLAAARGGTATGSLRVQRQRTEDAATWTADLEIGDVHLPVVGLPSPVTIEAGGLRLKGNEAALTIRKGRFSDTRFTGTYIHPAGDRRPHQLSLDIPALTAAELEPMLSTGGRRQGFLARTLRFGTPPAPEWLAGRSLRGSIRIHSLEAGGYKLENVRSRLLWEGSRLEFQNVTATLESAALHGNLAALLGGPVPVWRGDLQLRNYPWHDGRLDAEAALDASGWGLQFLSTLRLDGWFTADDIVVGPDQTWRAASGCFTLQTAGGPRLLLSGLSATIGAESYLGQGVAGSDGRLTIDLASTQRTLRVPGRVNGLSLDFPAAR